MPMFCVPEPQCSFGDAEMNKDKFEGGDRSAIGRGRKVCGRSN